MTDPSTVTTPTLEQRAANLSDHCPVGWNVKPHGPALAVYSSHLSTVPHFVLHGDDMTVLASIWAEYTGDLIALKELASKLGCAVADKLPGFFERQTAGFARRILGLTNRSLGRDQLTEDPEATPIRAYDAVAELAQDYAAVRKKWAGSASERDEFWRVLRALGLGDAEKLADFTARWLACAKALETAEKLVTKREARVFELRNEVQALQKAAEAAPIDRAMLAEALDCARREVVWVPESSRAGQVLGDEARESEMVRKAVEWCTANAGRGLAAELAQDAAHKLRASLNTMTGRPTARWAIAQALHIGVETAVDWTTPTNSPTASPAPTRAGETAAVGETEAGSYTVTTMVDGVEYAAKYTAVPGPRLEADGSIDAGFADAPSQARARAAGWTGITWMSGKGRAKSLTIHGLRFDGDVQAGVAGEFVLVTDPAEAVPPKLRKVLNRGKRLYTFHLPKGVKRYGHISGWSHRIEGARVGIVARLSPALSDKPAPQHTTVRQGIAWRRPGHDVDSFVALPIRPTYDTTGNHVIEVRGQLPDDLQAEIRQVMRDRPDITVTTANGAKIRGPVIAWEQQLAGDGVTWLLTVPQRAPLTT